MNQAVSPKHTFIRMFSNQASVTGLDVPVSQVVTGLNILSCLTNTKKNRFLI